MKYDNNNIFGHIDIPFTKDLLDMIVLPVKVDNDRHILNIELSKLTFRHEQTICLKNQGMLRINEKMMTDLFNKIKKLN